MFFASVRGEGERDLYRKAADFSGAAQRLLEREDLPWPNAISADGRWIVYENVSANSRGDIWILPLEGEIEPLPFLETPFDENNATLSPDGRFIAYQSDESGRIEIYVQPFPDGGRRSQITAQGGRHPLWSAEGREIFYLDEARSRMMVVRVRTEPEFEAGAPSMLFESMHVGSVDRNWDVTPDGERFVMVHPGRRQLNIVLSWFDDLERLVPAED